MALESLNLGDFSDREVLLVLLDVCDADGWAYAYDVGTQLGVVDEHARRAAANRLSWMVRFGAVEREHLRDADGHYRYINDDRDRPKYGQRWRLTDVGREIATASLRKGDETALGRLRDEQLPLVARWLDAQAHRNGHQTMAKLVDREWQRGALVRKR